MDTVWSGCLQSVTKGLAAKDTMSTWPKYWCEWWPRHKLSTWKHFHFLWCATSTSTEFSTLTFMVFLNGTHRRVFNLPATPGQLRGSIGGYHVGVNPYGRVLFTSDPGVVWWWYSEAFSSTEISNIYTNQYTNRGLWNELACYWTWNEIRSTHTFCG